MISPKSPRADPKISMTRILIKTEASCASARTQVVPETPTQTPQMTLDKPTSNPDQKSPRAHLKTCV